MKKETNFHFWYVFLAIWGVLLLHGMWVEMSRVESIPYSQFISDLESGRVGEITIAKDQIMGKLKNPSPGTKSEFITTRVDPDLAQKLSTYHVKFTGVVEDNFVKDVLSWLLPILVFFGIWIFLVNRFAEKSGFGEAGLMSVGQSKAKVYVENVKVSFADVAGVDEAKEELKEVVNFLKEPQQYARLGGRMPKGILLVGPPGCGKTLLARAVAGEAGVPFFSISGSEFVEMFVGVGAARVRDLFKQAEKSAPCIIFIDELDALGRARAIGPLSGGHDEKEQTLNQLLVELDGFDPRQGVVLLAATNRPEILDPALLRAGRFDRHVLVDRPDKKGRIDILKVHLGAIKLDETCDAEKIAALTPGFTGADLANLVNEAALLAARRKGEKVTMDDFNAAIERIVAGLEKKNRLLNPKERKVVAYHETGHTLVSLSIPGSDPVQKVSIIPRGIGALGYTMQRPTEDRYLMSKQELENKMTILMGGRAAEALIFGDISTGAADDLSKATDIAHNMVCRYGMNRKLGPVAYEVDPGGFLHPGTIADWQGRRFSEDTARHIDQAVHELVQSAFDRATQILTHEQSLLVETAEKLLWKETLTQDELPKPPLWQGDNNRMRTFVTP